MSLLKQYRKMAAGGEHFRGLSLVQHADAIGELIAKHKARTLLDYGSGAGQAYNKPHRLHLAWGVDIPTRYDPAFPKFANLPAGKFDGVICSDVAEHIPIDEVPVFIARLFGYAERFVWASVCCRLANKTFPDGTNLHVTVRPMAWWTELFAQESARTGVPFRLSETP
jgi:hypothetical protein